MAVSVRGTLCQDSGAGFSGAQSRGGPGLGGAESLEPDALDAGFAGRRSGGEKRRSRARD